jgi:hypothetical protein
MLKAAAHNKDDDGHVVIFGLSRDELDGLKAGRSILTSMDDLPCTLPFAHAFFTHAPTLKQIDQLRDMTEEQRKSTLVFVMTVEAIDEALSNVGRVSTVMQCDKVTVVVLTGETLNSLKEYLITTLHNLGIKTKVYHGSPTDIDPSLN